MPQEYLRSPSLALLSSKFLRVPLIQVDICVPINQLSIAEAGCCIGNLLAQALCPNLYNQFSRSIRVTQLEYPLQSMVQCRQEWVAEAQTSPQHEPLRATTLLRSVEYHRRPIVPSATNNVCIIVCLSFTDFAIAFLRRDSRSFSFQDDSKATAKISEIVQQLNSMSSNHQFTLPP